MSDQYVPPQPPVYTPGAVPTAADPYRNAARPELPPIAPVKSGGSGFGAGILVAAVFVVVAILAGAIYGYTQNYGPIGGTAPAAQPAVTIQNNAAPAAPVAADPAPTAPAPAPAVPATPPVADPVAPPAAPVPADPVTPPVGDPPATPPAGTTAPAAPANP